MRVQDELRQIADSLRPAQASLVRLMASLPPGLTRDIVEVCALRLDAVQGATEAEASQLDRYGEGE